MPAREATAALLPLSRRVDWRFLLPDPLLGAVIGLDPVAPMLAESLQIFSASLTMLAPEDAGDARWRECGDLLIIADPSRQTLERALPLLKPGAYIYVEAQGLLPRLKRWRRPPRAQGATRGTLWRPGAYGSLLQQLGFTEIQAHWHWPNFESCKMMIPLHSPAAAHLALDRGGQSLQARIRTGLGRALVHSGLLAWVVPYFSVLARWGEHE